MQCSRTALNAAAWAARPQRKTTSRRYSLAIVRSVNAGELVSRLRSLVRRESKQSRWLVVADVNVFVRAFLGHPDGANNRIVEAALTGVLVLVMSEDIRAETIEVLSREETGGYDPEVAAEIMEPVCKAARMVFPGPDDPQYRKVVRDPDDRIIIRTAAGTYVDEDLASMPKRAIVSGDTHSFPRGRSWYGFRYFTAAEFWHMLQDED